MKRFPLALAGVLALAGALLLGSSPVSAQNCSGQPDANTVCAGPSSGGAGFPSFRALGSGDVPAAALPPGVNANVLNTQTANYTVVTTDCGKTLQLGTGSTGLFTLTVPSVSGFATTCAVVLENGDTGRGKLISGLTGLSILYPKQTASIGIVNGAWALLSNVPLWKPTANVTFCVDATSGSDSAADGLTPYSVALGVGSCAVPAEAFRTMQHCVDVVSGQLIVQNDVAKATCKWADNSAIAQTVNLRPLISNPLYQSNQATISGNCTTPGNVVVKGQSSGVIFSSASMTQAWTIDCMDINPTSATDTAIFADWNTNLNIGSIRFTGPMTSAINSRYHSVIEILAGSALVVSANMAQFATVTDGGLLLAQGGPGSITMTLTGTPAWSNAFCVLNSGGECDLNAITFSGAATGQRFFANGPVSFGAATGSNYPGNAAGTFGAGISFSQIGSFQGGAAFASPAQGGLGTSTAPTSAQIPIGTGGGVYAPQSITGCTLTAGGALTCPSGSGVPQNVLNTQTANYTVLTTDCGKTIQAGTGSTGLFTVTLPAVAGFAPNCVLDVYNGDTGRGKILSGFPVPVATSPNNILWPGDTIQVGIVNGAWAVLGPGTQRHRIVAATTIYVDNTNGADTNDCLATTTGACKTIQKAFDYLNTWDGNAQTVTVSVADGTYTNTLTVNGPFHGNPSVTLQGNTGTPANVVISTTSAAGITLTNGAAMSLGGFKITTATSGNSIDVLNASFLTINGAMEYGASAGFHMRSASASTITISANYTISGNATNHWRASNYAVISAASLTITLTGTPAFTAFAVPAGGFILPGGDTFSGSATGSQYTVTLGGVLNNSGALPGSTGGTVATGGTVNTPGTPSVSSCGGGSPAVTAGSTDFAGSVTEGTTATACTITFATATTFKACNVSLSTGAAVGITSLGSTLVVAHGSLSSNVLYWQCSN